MRPAKIEMSVHQFVMNSIDGQPHKLSDYKGKVLLIVNTASLCGFTPQYKDLQTLFDKYSAQGLRIAAFPANEFGAQEPGSDASIKGFCASKYSVTFDLHAKIAVKGDAIHPLYKHLTEESPFPGEIPWNFAKFLVDGKGKVVARFGPDDNPMGKAVVAAVEKALAS